MRPSFRAAGEFRKSARDAATIDATQPEFPTLSETQATITAPAPRRALVDVRRGEAPLAALSFCYFFFVLAAYYTIRPLRDALAVGGGVDTMQYLFTATFVCMLAIVPLYGWLTSRLARRTFLPVVYAFFIVNLVAIHVAFRLVPESVWLGRAFFVWVSVFNLFVVSVFWSVMADIFDSGQARRMFGIIAAGGSLGAVTGPFLVRTWVETIQTTGLPLLSAGLLAAAMACLLALVRLTRDRPRAARRDDPSLPMGGSVLAGAKLLFQYPFLAAITGFMLLGTFSGSLLYFQQAQVISEHFSDPARITRVFAELDLASNALTIVIQVVLTARLIGWLGMGLALALLPVVAAVGFAVISYLPVLGLIVVIQVLRRAILFGITNPASGILYTLVGPESKYKFKNFVDTVVWRGGDTSGSWAFTGLMAAGAGIGGVALAGMGVAMIWVALSLWLGRRFNRMRNEGVTLP